jgi:hypothetical protein
VHTANLCGFGTISASAYRSPTTNAWLASVSRGVARDSQHERHAMDIRFGVPVFKIRQAARSLQMGGVGFIRAPASCTSTPVHPLLVGHGAPRVIEGDATQLDVDASVHATSKSLLGGGGVDGAIRRRRSQLLAGCRTPRLRHGDARS